MINGGCIVNGPKVAKFLVGVRLLINRIIHEYVESYGPTSVRSRNMVVDSELVAEPKWLLEVEIVIKRQEVLDVESNSVD
ncbi:hypothetical protein POVCU2_0052210 [Plasmodium ovale curtisi]|uniref:Uncharacterized protein n=1 Tax=Plasmodium ovale curtisi TaxID=864141 RepID=A0A1A8WAS5_PLAOA|nr:hypothetical protein POVCU2_0052210 [Plasmodium ovale curtisi]SBS98722.1 hypothetical protein POVCU1_048270 [Plasmodium ovale curtisi]